MEIWELVALLMGVGVKYYTSLEMRKLETVKSGLQQVKERLQSVQKTQTDAQREESGFHDRMQVMNEIIHDLQYRMTNSDELATKGVSDSMPPKSF